MYFSYAAVLVCVVSVTTASNQDSSYSYLPPKVPHGPIDSTCNREAEIALLIDDSRSIWSVHFAKEKAFLQRLAKKFHVSPWFTRFAAVTFSKGIYEVFRLGAYSNIRQVHNAIGNIQQSNGGTTDTYKGIQHIREYIFSEARPGVPKILIIVTDGGSQKRREAEWEATRAKNAGIRIFVVGIGSLDEDHLRDLVSEPVETYLYTVDGFPYLQSVEERIAQQVCLACSRDGYDTPGQTKITNRNDITPRKKTDHPFAITGFGTDHRGLHYPFNRNSKKFPHIPGIPTINQHNLGVPGYKNHIFKHPKHNIDSKFYSPKNTGISSFPSSNNQPHQRGDPRYKSPPVYPFPKSSGNNYPQRWKNVPNYNPTNKRGPDYRSIPRPSRGKHVPYYNTNTRNHESKGPYPNTYSAKYPSYDSKTTNLNPLSRRGNQYPIAPVPKPNGNYPRHGYPDIRKNPNQKTRRYPDHLGNRRYDTNVGPRRTQYTNSGRELPYLPKGPPQYDNRQTYNSKGSPSYNDVRPYPSSKGTPSYHDVQSHHPNGYRPSVYQREQGPSYAHKGNARPYAGQATNGQPHHSVHNFPVEPSTFPACRSKPAEVVFVLEQSSSVFVRKAVTLVTEVIQYLDIGPGMTRVATVSYQEQAEVEYHLDQYYSKQELVERTARIPYHPLSAAVSTQGRTRTEMMDAFYAIKKEVFTETHGYRDTVTRVIVVITEEHWENYEQVREESYTLKDDGVHLFAIGVGPDVDPFQLQGVSSTPYEDHVFTLDNYDAIDGIKDKLTERMCHYF